MKRTHVYGHSRIPDIIPVEQLEHGRAYRYDGRCNHVGVWDAKNREVVCARFKFHPPKFLWPEPHWDTDQHHGTGQPYLALDDRAPEGWDVIRIQPTDPRYLRNAGRIQDPEDQLLNWLLELEKKYPEPEEEEFDE